MKRSVITGTGNYIPAGIKKNTDFLKQEFFDEHGVVITTSREVIIDKFQKITGIEERRYAPFGVDTSGMASYAAALAIEDSKIDPESLDLIIVAHNFGDVAGNSNQADTVPALASRVKHTLAVKNPHALHLTYCSDAPAG